MPPVRIEKPEEDRLALVTTQGRLLIYPCPEIPVLAKGKGNKLVQITPADLANGQDRLLHVVILPEGASLKLHAGQRSFTLKPGDWAGYQAARGSRGTLLPKGLQRVDRVEVLVVSRDGLS